MASATLFVYFLYFFRTIHLFIHPFAEGPLLFPHCSSLSRGPSAPWGSEPGYELGPAVQQASKPTHYYLSCATPSRVQIKIGRYALAHGMEDNFPERNYLTRLDQAMHSVDGWSLSRTCVPRFSDFLMASSFLIQIIVLAAALHCTCR